MVYGGHPHMKTPVTIGWPMLMQKDKQQFLAAIRQRWEENNQLKSGSDSCENVMKAFEIHPVFSDVPENKRRAVFCLRLKRI